MTARTTVLHVDDDPEQLRLSSSVFQDDGRFEAITAGSAAEGLERLSERQVNCVVSDSVQFPDGEAFVNVVGREYPDLPVILLTAKDPESVADELRGGSVTEYVRKADSDVFDTLFTHLSRVTDGSAPLDVVEADHAESGADTAACEQADAETDGTNGASVGIPDLGPEWRIVGLHDWTDPEELTASVVAAVAGVVDAEMEELPPLYPMVDPEAVANVVRPQSDGSYRHGVRVQFPYVGYDCLVTGDGAVAVREQSVEA